MSNELVWLAATQQTLAGYRRMIDAALAQLTDEQFVQRPADQFNSVAVLLRHLGGNLQSRWTNFLTEDGEKPDRDRDLEFADWPGTRQTLIEYFDAGWIALTESLAALTPAELAGSVVIRGEAHTVPQAIQRSVTHIAYHVGQLMMVARLVRGHSGWQWLTIRPGGTKEHNAQTWGTAASRGIAGDDHDRGSGV